MTHRNPRHPVGEDGGASGLESGQNYGYVMKAWEFGLSGRQGSDSNDPFTIFPLINE